MIKTYQVTARELDLQPYCYLSENKQLYLVEWQNGEGFDLELDGQRFALTWGQLEALNILAHYKD